MTSIADLDGAFEAVRRQVLALGQELPDRAGTVQAAIGDLVVTIAWEPAAGTGRRAAPEPGTPSLVAQPPQPATVIVEPTPLGQELHYFTAQTVGVFYSAPEPGAASFVEVGDLITAGRQVGIVEAMKLMIPIESDRGGRIVDVLAENGSPVEYGQRLFAVDVTAAGREAA